MEKARNELISAMGEAGLSLRKWASSNGDILKDLPLEIVDGRQEIEFLGIKWNVLLDTLSIAKVEWKMVPENMTRMQLLSQIAKVFDSMGYIHPVVIKGKMLIRQLYGTIR